jgi:hypothetical protein
MTKQKREFYLDEIRQYNSNSETIIKDAPGVLRYSRFDYNCFGYAVNFYDWLDIESFIYLADKYEDDFDILNNMFEDCCDELEDRYGLRRCRSTDVHLEANEHLIAFRVGFDDFHFARLNSDGLWTHKPGSGYIREMTEFEFNTAWCPTRTYPYVSDIAYFIVGKGTNFYE